MLRIDAELVARLEASSAEIALRTVEAHGRTEGEGASPRRLDRGALVAMGPGRYLNRAIGLGSCACLAGQVAAIEAFFVDAAMPPMLELSSWAADDTVRVLRERGYGPQWFRSVFAAAVDPLEPRSAPTGSFEVVAVTAGSIASWLDVLADGNGVTTAPARRISDEFARASAAAVDSIDLLALADGAPVGCASLQIHEGIGWLGGAATRRAWTGRGIQATLLRERMRLAAERRLDLVAATAIPSGVSARNLTRAGLAHVDTQVVVSRPNERADD